MGVWRQRSSSKPHESQLTTKDVPDPLEQSVVQNRSVKSTIFPFALVMDKVMEQVLSEPALVVDCFIDVLVYPFHDQWNCTHECGLE